MSLSLFSCYGLTVATSDTSNTKFARDAWLRALRRTAGIDSNPDVTLPVLIEQLAKQYEAAPALESHQSCMSYRELSARCNQYSRWGITRGLRSGDTVALVMGNCPEYLAIWIGLSRIGVAVALANTHLRGEALVHSLACVTPKLGIVDGAGERAVFEAPGAMVAPAIFVQGMAAPGCQSQHLELSGCSSEPLNPAECALPSLDSTALYIYTSGTTGLPKAARVSHYRVMQWSHWFAGMLDIGPIDRMYDCLPLYHSVGGVVATCATLVGGGSVVIRERFTASDFWRDVRDQGCTLFQYIGELCRYLTNAAPQPGETEHALRIACGNGLRADVWETFRTRFRIPRILEYYAATEANFSLYNCEGEPGAIGRIPAFLAQKQPVALLRFDVDRGEPARNDNGVCEPCTVGEVGEAVGLIPDAGTTRTGRFEGYTDEAAAAAKILRHVFRDGDCWYRTGDLMRRDERGFFYFVDRVGDTYRWKGENVASAQVVAVLAATPEVIDAIVYGVRVPGTDGRAGMAALVVSPNFDLKHFRAVVAMRLPDYARPIFLRLVPALQLTATFKPRSRDFEVASFNPAASADPLYVDDVGAGVYRPLDTALHAAICEGRFRL